MHRLSAVVVGGGVTGLALDDYCAINTSLKTLTKCFAAMGSKKKAATPPLRDSRLTHLLALALGDDTALIHCLVYVPGRRAMRAEAVSAIGWASKATGARLKTAMFPSPTTGHTGERRNLPQTVPSGPLSRRRGVPRADF